MLPNWAYHDSEVGAHTRGPKDLLWTVSSISLWVQDHLADGGEIPVGSGSRLEFMCFPGRCRTKWPLRGIRICVP